SHPHRRGARSWSRSGRRAWAWPPWHRTWLRREAVRTSARAWSIELLGDRVRLGALDQRDLGDRMVAVELGVRTHGPEAFVRGQRLADRSAQRILGLAHGRALSLGRLEVRAAVDGLGLHDLTGLVVDELLGVLVPLRRVNGQLELATLQLVLRRDRRALGLGRLERVLERHLGVFQVLAADLRLVLVLIFIAAGNLRGHCGRHAERDRDRRQPDLRAHGTLLPYAVAANRRSTSSQLRLLKRVELARVPRPGFGA